MNKSESIANLAKALAAAQGLIGGAIKDKTNPAFRSKYADLGAVVEAIREPLSRNGLSYVQIIHDAEGCAAIETLIMHASGEFLSCGVLSVPVSKRDAQGYGSALTYCRRYSLSAAFGVAPEDDDGNAASAQHAPQQTANNKTLARLEAAAKNGLDALRAEFSTIGKTQEREAVWAHHGNDLQQKAMAADQKLKEAA